MPALTATALRLARPRIEVELALKPGEVVGVIGPNGAGKSTLIRLLAGLAAPDSGRVALLGRPLGDWPARERAARLGYMPQHFAPHWDWRVREMLALGAGRASRPVPVAGLAEGFALSPLLDRPWSVLSGGERARVLAAMVLAPDPPVILADEPEAALDIGGAGALMARLEACAAAGAAVLVALHDLNLAARWCGRLVLLVEGRVRRAGAPGAVLADPALDEAYGAPLRRVRAPEGDLLTGPVPRRGGVSAPAPRED